MMRLASVLIMLMLLPGYLSGQLISLSGQYLNNTLVINPAFAGCHEALSTSLSYRNQWVGFSGAPENIILSAHAPLNHDRVGVGLLLERSTIGIYNTTTFTGNYAYRMELYEGKLALGLGFGAAVYNVAWDRLIAEQSGDELLSDNTPTAILPDFSLGGYYYTRKYFVGLSLPMFLSHDLNKNTGRYNIKNKFSDYTYLLSGGYFLDIKPGLRVLPSMLLKLHNGSNQADINAQVILKDKIWVGAGYRTSEVLVGMFQCQVNYQLRAAYSYDFNLGAIGNYARSSHEIVLSYVFSYVRKVAGPRQF